MEAKGHAIGVIVIVTLFVALLVLDPHKWTNAASPIRSVDPVDATIKSVYMDRKTTYTLVIDNNSAILVDDNRPRLIGSRVRLERVTRENGSVFYRFAN